MVEARRRDTARELRVEILERLGRRQSTAAVLFNHAVAERLGLGATDHKCLDVICERGPMSGSELSAITGLTSGAITGVVGRLEQAGYVDRRRDPGDGRKQVLSPADDRIADLDPLFAPMRHQLAEVLDGFDVDQLDAIATFLERSADCLFDHAVLLRAQALTRRPTEPESSIATVAT